MSLVPLWSLQKCDQGLRSWRGPGGAHAPSISLPQLPLKNPYNNLKRRSLEKKLTCFVCGFVFTFLSFYSTQNSFVLLCRGPMSFNDIRMEYLILQPDVFKILMDREKLEYFSDILKVIKNVDSADTSMISEMIQICVLIHVNLATSASGECLFSTARRIKS